MCRSDLPCRNAAPFRSRPSLPCHSLLAVLGCLKDGLFELHEGVAWGLLDPEFESQQRQQVRLLLIQ